MKNFLLKIIKTIIYQLLLLSLVFGVVVFAITPPTWVPAWETVWWKLMVYISAIKWFTCQNNYVIVWFNENDNYKPICWPMPQWDIGPKWDAWVKWPIWYTWPKWDTWAKWPTWYTWPKWDTWAKWLTWYTWPKWDTWAKWPTWYTWPKWDTWAIWDKWPNWICNVTPVTSKTCVSYDIWTSNSWNQYNEKMCNSWESALLVSSSESLCTKINRSWLEWYWCNIHPTTDYWSTVWVTWTATIKCCK